MLTQGESVEAHALRERGWSCRRSPAPAKRQEDGPGVPVRRTGEPGSGSPRARTCSGGCASLYGKIRFGDDRLVGDDAVRRDRGAGYAGSYPSFTRELRARGLRPGCEDCAAAGVPERSSRGSITRRARRRSGTGWSCRDPPSSWGWGKDAHLLVGALADSAPWRGVSRSPSSSRT